MVQNRFVRRIVLVLGALALAFMIYNSSGHAPNMDGISFNLIFGIFGFFFAIFFAVILFSIYVSRKNKWYEDSIKAFTESFYEHKDVYQYTNDIEEFVESIRASNRKEKAKNSYISTAYVTAGMFIYNFSGNCEKALELFSKVIFSHIGTMHKYNYCYFRGMVFLDMGDIIRAEKELKNMHTIFKGTDYLKEILNAYLLYHKGLSDEAEMALNNILESKGKEIRTEMVYLQAVIDKEKKRFDYALTKLEFLLEHGETGHIATKSKKLLEEIKQY